MTLWSCESFSFAITASSTFTVETFNSSNAPPAASFMNKGLDKRANSFPPFMKKEPLSFATTPQKTFLTQTNVGTTPQESAITQTTVNTTHIQQPAKTINTKQSHANINTHSFAVPSSNRRTLSTHEGALSNTTGSNQSLQHSFTQNHQTIQTVIQNIQPQSFTKNSQKEQPNTHNHQVREQTINQSSVRHETNEQGRLLMEENKRRITDFTAKYSKLLDSNISSIITVQRECVKMMESTHSLREQLSNFENEMIVHLDSLIPSSNTSNGDGDEVFRTPVSSTLDNHHHKTSNHKPTTTISKQHNDFTSVANLPQNGTINCISSSTNTTTTSFVNRSNIRHASPRQNILSSSTNHQTTTSQPAMNNISATQSLVSSLHQQQSTNTPLDFPTNQSTSSMAVNQNKPKSNLDSVLSTMTFHPKRKSSSTAPTTQKLSQDAPVAKKPRETLSHHFSEQNTSFATNSRLHPPNQSTPLTKLFKGWFVKGVD